ncbi:MAG: hypothetical protein E7445_08950 [Ruminococcaceae bacterium]|nr:hypothetical protein [Oscillospiraceae bacterium]
MAPCKKEETRKERALRQKKDSSCHIGAALPEEKWMLLTEQERSKVSYWNWNLIVPKENPLGDSYFYRQFEAETPQTMPSGEEVEQAKEAYLEPYDLLSFADSSIQLKTTMETIQTEVNENLSNLCLKCSIYQNALAGKEGKPLCFDGFTKGFYVPFYFAMQRTRQPRSDAHKTAPDRIILIRDLRFLGHPVIVALRYPKPQNKLQRDLLHSLNCCYPGSGKNSNRYSKRLGERIDEALMHGMRPEIIAEGSALPRDIIYHWQDRETRTAARVRQKATAKYNLECMHFSSTALYKHTVIHPHKGAPSYSRGYRFVIRQEEGKAPRLTSIYPEYEWALMEKLCYGILGFENSRRHVPDRFPLSPLRLFNLAVDFLSTPDNRCFTLSVFTSPVLVALVFLTVLDPNAVYMAFDQLDSKSADYLYGCYGNLLRIREQFEDSPSEFIPRVLHVFREEYSPNTNSVWETTIMDWYGTWDTRAYNAGIYCPCFLTQPPLPEISNALLSEDSLNLSFPLDSGIAGMGELITRLLIFNPATMSATPSPGSNANNQPLSTSYPYQCKPDGTLDYENVRPGIDIEDLNSLLEQGFLFSERTDLFRMRTQNSIGIRVET